MECQIPNLWISAYNPSWVIAQTHKTCPVRKDCYWRITFCGVNLKVGSKSLLIPTCSKVTLYHRQACLPNSQKHTLISRITKGTGKQTIAFGRAMERRRRGRALGSTTYADNSRNGVHMLLTVAFEVGEGGRSGRAVMGGSTDLPTKLLTDISYFFISFL